MIEVVQVESSQICDPLTYERGLFSMSRHLMGSGIEIFLATHGTDTFLMSTVIAEGHFH